MLSIIIDTTDAEDRLAGLLAALTPAAVDGVVKEVLVVDTSSSEVVAAEVDALCEDMGATLAGDLSDAIEQAKSDWLLVLPADIRFRNGWLEELNDHLAGGGREAILVGDAKGGLLAGLGPKPAGVLVSKAAAMGLNDPDLQGLRRKVGARAARLG
ncbi:MAG: cell wall biosynthesis glycosyltransferase [Phenylobacterium sp.]